MAKAKKEAGQEAIMIGHVYEGEKGRRVIPFNVDFANGMVRLFPVARRGGEENMRTTEFLAAFSHLGPEAEVNAKAAKKAESDKK